MTRITLYTKAGCHLCEEMLAVIQRVAEDSPLDVELVDITQNDELYSRYWDVIPVIVVAGGPTFVSRVDERELREALNGKE